ncbi:hypothetical protein TNIN_280131 [Trichonephila inaurata madagascariensis]|uniref:Uncharacterized protein n=1 Tax=Trichonephila inaurata madagascariensis TaxID=2747483 RepID=A0A8X7C1H3_9ARAC|nr:hypothetical protein TNIN_280131 [Trichonephila inaurata madagascariensis]
MSVLCYYSCQLGENLALSRLRVVQQSKKKPVFFASHFKRYGCSKYGLTIRCEKLLTRLNQQPFLHPSVCAVFSQLVFWLCSSGMDEYFQELLLLLTGKMGTI